MYLPKNLSWFIVLITVGALGTSHRRSTCRATWALIASKCSHIPVRKNRFAKSHNKFSLAYLHSKQTSFLRTGIREQLRAISAQVALQVMRR